jgi:hypothetical protein
MKVFNDNYLADLIRCIPNPLTYIYQPLITKPLGPMLCRALIYTLRGSEDIILGASVVAGAAAGWAFIPPATAEAVVRIIMEVEKVRNPNPSLSEKALLYAIKGRTYKEVFELMEAFSPGLGALLGGMAARPLVWVPEWAATHLECHAENWYEWSKINAECIYEPESDWGLVTTAPTSIACAA